MKNNKGRRNELTKLKYKKRLKQLGLKDGENIFNKFFRAQKAVEKDKEGFGIGLFATKNIIEKHHGKIWFESKDESGTTFFILLPIS